MSTSTDPQVGDPTEPAGRRRFPVKWLLLGVLALVAILVLVWFVRRDGGGEDGWETVWSDEFDGDKGSQPSEDDWQFSLGTGYPGGAQNWGTGEIQTYTDDPENASLDGEGRLLITPIRDASGAWRSARLETRRTDFQPEEGGKLRVEARIQLPDGGPGYWGAFWMLGEPFRGVYTNWPKVGEIDIMEYKGIATSEVFGTIHCGTAPGGPCNENNGIGSSHRSEDGPLTEDFHTYAVEWDRSGETEEIRWYVDDTQFHTVGEDDVDEQTWKDATDHGYFVLLNVAIGGAFGGPPDQTTRSGVPMLIDEVTVSRG